MSPLSGQLVVVLGGSAGIGLETARAARAEGAGVIIAGRDRERLERAGRELGALRTAAFDVTDPETLAAFFDELPAVDHLLLTGGGPYYATLAELDFDEVARDFDRRTTLPIGRVVRPADVALMAVHLMTNTAVTGATFDIDGGQQLVA